MSQSETDVSKVEDILALVLTSVGGCQGELAEPIDSRMGGGHMGLTAGRCHLSKSPVEQAQASGSCLGKLQTNQTHHGAVAPSSSTSQSSAVGRML